ncbi:MAG: RrF2 family transcriptional regulator [Candidatus Acidiferrales bacterium]
MLYSKPCEYAIRALVHIARNSLEAAGGDAIARAEDIPKPILGKVLQDLVRKGLLASRRGPGGGFQLARRADLITLRDIVAAVDGLDHFLRCSAGLPQCNDDSPCPVHDQWKPIRTNLMEFFETTTLDRMAETVHRKEKRLSRNKRSRRL